MGKLYQALTGLAACFGAILMGSLNVWPSYTLKLYQSSNTTILSAPMTDFEASLVGSVPSLGAMLGTGVAGPVIDTLGRKRGAMLLTLPCMFCWVIIEFSSSSIPILIARFIGGVGGGANLVYAPIYISEVAEPSIRGALASGTVFLYCAGALISYLSGWVLSYGMIIWVNIVLSVLGLLLQSVVVDSPLFLLKQKKEQEALKALAHYRTGSISSKSVLEELSVMKQQLLPAIELVSVNTGGEAVDEPEKEKLNIDNGVAVEPPKAFAITTLFTTPSSCKAFKLVGTSLTLQVMMGMVAVQVYTGELFHKAAPDLSPDLCSVLFALVLFAGGTVTALTADKAGRRVLVITSSAMVALCMCLCGFLMQTEVAPAWVTAVVILVYCFSFMFGAGSVPYVLLAEVFTPEVQGIASMILVEWVWLLNFLLIAVFPLMQSGLGIHGSCYAFACVAVSNTIFSYFFVPETKGMSNKQIQELFTK